VVEEKNDWVYAEATPAALGLKCDPPNPLDQFPKHRHWGVDSG
jgi:hypothetical protein